MTAQVTKINKLCIGIDIEKYIDNDECSTIYTTDEDVRTNTPHSQLPLNKDSTSSVGCIKITYERTKSDIN